jgi:hypothetical protein
MEVRILTRKKETGGSSRKLMTQLELSCESMWD